MLQPDDAEYRAEIADRPELSAIVLCYRGGKDVLKLAESLRQSLAASGVPFELILVANYWPGADDETPAAVTAYAGSHPEVTAIADAKQGGMGWDMRSGISRARGAFLIVIDGDGQNPVEDVLRMYWLMKATGLDVAKGRRITRGDGAYRSVVSKIYNVTFRLLFRTGGLSDINGKPKGLTRAAYEVIRPSLRADDWFADAEIVLAARNRKLTIGELPVAFLGSTRPSFVRPSAISEFVVNMIAYRFGRHR